jgi:hypothetical protein
VAPSNQGPTDPDEWEQVPPHPHRHQRDRTHPGSLTRQPRHDSRMRPQIQETAEAQPRFAWPATYRHASSVAGGLTTVEVAVPDAPTNLPGHTCQMPRTMAAGAAWGGIEICPVAANRRCPLTAISSRSVLVVSNPILRPEPLTAVIYRHFRGDTPRRYVRAFGDIRRPSERPRALVRFRRAAVAVPYWDPVATDELAWRGLMVAARPYEMLVYGARHRAGDPFDQCGRQAVEVPQRLGAAWQDDDPLVARDVA